MAGLAPVGSLPVASLPVGSSSSTAFSQASRARAIWRVKTTLRPIAKSGVRRATIQRSIVLYGLRRPPITQPFVYVVPPQAQLPTRKLQMARLRYAITYRVAHKPWRPPHRFARPGPVPLPTPQRVTWFGVEALHDGAAKARVSWTGAEALHDGAAKARVSWTGVEVLRTNSVTVALATAGGQALTAAQGSLAAQAIVALTGQTLSVAQGNAVIILSSQSFVSIIW